VTFALTVLVICLSALLSTVVWRRHYTAAEGVDKLPLPPGSLGWPIIGESLSFVLRGSQFLIERFKTNGPIFKTHLFGSPTIRVAYAENLKPLINCEPGGLVPKMPPTIKHIVGPKSILNTDADDHGKMKKTLLEAFTPTRLADYVPSIQGHIRSHLTSWCGQGQILGFQACERMTEDIILELVMGCQKEEDKDHVVRNAINTINNNVFSAPVNFPGGGFNKAMKARQTVTEFILKRLQQDGDKDHVSILDVLLSAHTQAGDTGLKTEEIIDNIITMLFAGSSTSSSTFCNMLMLLGQHPDEIEKLRDEYREAGLLGQEDPRDLTYAVLQTLDYTKCVIKETLRLFAPAGGMFRIAKRDLTAGGYQIPSGWQVIYSIRDTHQDSQLFTDVKTFRPSRWMEKDLCSALQRDTTCNFLPFGMGPRVCLGRTLSNLEMTVFLVEVVRLATFTLSDLSPPVMVFMPVTKPKNDLPITFERRNTS